MVYQTPRSSGGRNRGTLPCKAALWSAVSGRAGVLFFLSGVHNAPGHTDTGPVTRKPNSACSSTAQALEKWGLRRDFFRGKRKREQLSTGCQAGNTGLPNPNPAYGQLCGRAVKLGAPSRLPFLLPTTPSVGVSFLPAGPTSPSGSWRWAGLSAPPFQGPRLHLQRDHLTCGPHRGANGRHEGSASQMRDFGLHTSVLHFL